MLCDIHSLHENLGGEGEHVGAVEGRLEGEHVVQDTAQGPNIRLLPIRLALHYLWAERTTSHQHHHF